MSQKLLSVILAIVVMASLCTVNALAANEKTARTDDIIYKDDKVVFIASLKYGDETHLVAAIDAEVTYDAEVLKLESVKDVEYPVFGRATTNPNTPGTIIFNAADGVYGYDFAAGGDIVKVTFTVLKDADATEVKFATKELFDVTVDPANNGQAKDGVAKNDITTGVTAAVAVECPHVSDTDTAKASDTEKPVDTTDTATEKADDNNNGGSPKTGDVATVAMMLVFAAAAVVLVSKKRA